MARTTNSAIRSRSDALRGDDVFIPGADRYAAVINPTDDTIQSWAYGRRAVFVPGELYDPKRCSVQFIDRRIAKKMVYNQRRLLEIISFAQGKRLLKRARELDDFYAAYAELTGRTLSKAAQEIRRKRTLTQLRSQLDRLGIPVKRDWDIATCKAILRDPEMAFDLDAGHAPVMADDDDLTFIEPVSATRRGDNRVAESGREGDFFEPETLDDDDKPPETLMAESLLKEEHGLLPPVVEDKHFDEAEDREIEAIEAVVSRVKAQQSDNDEAVHLREQLRVLGVTVHPRTRNPTKLRKMIADEKAKVAVG